MTFQLIFAIQKLICKQWNLFFITLLFKAHRTEFLLRIDLQVSHSLGKRIRSVLPNQQHMGIGLIWIDLSLSIQVKVLDP